LRHVSEGNRFILTNAMTGTDLFNKYESYEGMFDEMCFNDVIRSQYSKVFEDMSEIPVDLLRQKDVQAGELKTVKRLKK